MCLLTKANDVLSMNLFLFWGSTAGRLVSTAGRQSAAFACRYEYCPDLCLPHLYMDKMVQARCASVHDKTDYRSPGMGSSHFWCIPEHCQLPSSWHLWKERWQFQRTSKWTRVRPRLWEGPEHKGVFKMREANLLHIASMGLYRHKLWPPHYFWVR